MNTPVKFELAKLLKEKGFTFRKREIHYNPVNGFTKYEDIAPTIAEVVMWLYEKHGIWIRVTPKPYSHFLTHWRWEHMSTDYSTRNCGWKKVKDYMTPTEAYEAAIEYTLTKLI